MPKLIKVAPEQLVRLPLQRVKSLHAASAILLDLTEEILEEYGEYTPEFLAGIAEAEADIKAGRVYSLKSLDELIKQPLE